MGRVKISRSLPLPFAIVRQLRRKLVAHRAGFELPSREIDPLTVDVNAPQCLSVINGPAHRVNTQHRSGILDLGIAGLGGWYKPTRPASNARGRQVGKIGRSLQTQRNSATTKQSVVWYPEDFTYW